jgi:two-component system, chemotaxis family, response regulator Rcp1
MVTRTRPPIEILLVEDNPGDAHLTVELLEEAAAPSHVDVVATGEEALAVLQREGAHAGNPRPDLILLDLNLPGISGHEVLARIKADPRLRTIPVIVLTSSTSEGDVHGCYDLHASAYIVKPVELDQVSRVVRAVEEFWLSVVRYPRG